MSGFMGSLEGLMQNQGHADAAGGLLSTAFASAGGLQGIMSKFEAAGLGNKVQSWTGGGGNLPLAAEEVTRVFPPQQIESFAEAHGVPASVATEMLAHLLPHAVDSQTPGGQVPPDPATTDPDASATQGQPMTGADAAAPQGPGGGFDFGGLVQRLMSSR